MRERSDDGGVVTAGGCARSRWRKWSANAEEGTYTSREDKRSNMSAHVEFTRAEDRISIMRSEEGRGRCHAKEMISSRSSTGRRGIVLLDGIRGEYVEKTRFQCRHSHWVAPFMRRQISRSGAPSQHPRFKLFTLDLVKQRRRSTIGKVQGHSVIKRQCDSFQAIARSQT